MLVTGGAGFMGSAFIRKVLSDQFFQGTLINLDCLTYAGDARNVASVQNDSRYKFYKGNINDQELLERIYQRHPFSTIVHFAAESHVDHSITRPKIFLETNVLGTYSLLEFLRKHPKIRLHLISTDEVYGMLQENDPPFTELSRYNPSSPYAASKACADHLALAYAKTYQLNVTVSHASNNYGPYQYPEKLIPLTLARLSTNSAIPVYGTGKNVRDWLFVEDHSSAILEILSHAKSLDVVNVGGENERTNLEMISALIEIYAQKTQQAPSKLKKLITFVADRPGHDFRYALSNEKVYQLTSWRPKYSLEEGLAKTIDWYLEHVEGKQLHMCHPR